MVVDIRFCLTSDIDVSLYFYADMLSSTETTSAAQAAVSSSVSSTRTSVKTDNITGSRGSHIIIDTISVFRQYVTVYFTN